MEEIAEYQINGIKYTQTFLSIDELDKFSDIMTKVIKSLKGKKLKGITDFLKELKKSGQLLNFLNLVLKGEKSLDDYNQVKPVRLLEIVNDFFCLNEFVTATGKIYEMLFNLLTDQNLIALINSLPEMTKMMKSVEKSIGIPLSQLSPTETSPNIGMSEKK